MIPALDMLETGSDQHMENPDERRSTRANVLLRAVVEWQSGRTPVRIGNLSAHGALVIGEGLPDRDTDVSLRCHGIIIPGWIMWIGPGRAGIQFEQPIKPESLAYRKLENKILITPDMRTLDFRRPGFRGNQMTDDERKVIEEWNRPPAKPDDDDG